MKITILGAGNGAIAAAAHMGMEGHEVTLSNRNPDRLRPFLENMRITVEGQALPNKEVPIHAIQPDVPLSVQQAEVIMVCVPTIGHAYYAGQLAPVLRPDQTVLLNPGHMGGALQFAGYLRKGGYTGRLNLCETSTLTYVARMTGPTAVGIYDIIDKAFLASLPADAPAMAKALEMYPNLTKAPNVLYTAMCDINAVMHPPGMLLNAGLIQRTGGDFTFYYDGTTPAVGTLVEALDEERLAVARALGMEVESFLEIFYSWGYTTKEAYESKSVYEALRQSAPNRSIKSPDSLTHRYVSEDVGNGLVPMSLLGRIAGVATPVMDGFIELCGRANGVDYWTEGLTLEKLGLGGAKTTEELVRAVAQIA